MFPQTAISYVKDLNCHIGTTICFWLGLGVPGGSFSCPVRLPSPDGAKDPEKRLEDRFGPRETRADADQRYVANSEKGHGGIM